MTETPELGNLDARRAARARTRAAERAGRGETLPIIFGGRVIATLGAEFPLDVLSPLTDMDVDLPLLIRQAMSIFTGSDDEEAQRLANIQLMIDILVTNPQLPRELIVATQQVGRRLLGEEGYAAFVEQRPSPWDVAALIGDVVSWYGVSLGESSSASTTSEATGVTSATTSSITSGLTPTESSNGLASPASSAPRNS